MTDHYKVVWSEASDKLADTARAEESWYAGMAASLVQPGDRLAVDIGCGGAGMTRALAQTLSGGRAVGVDGDETVLAKARERVADLPADGPVRIEFIHSVLSSDVSALRESLGEPVDVLWAAQALHHMGDQQAIVDSLATLLAPGGRMALVEGGMTPRHLPWDVGVGDPGLEIRLDAARNEWFARMREELPGSVRLPYGWPEALRRAGLADLTTRSYLMEIAPPLAESERLRIIESLLHRSERLGPAGLLSEADQAAWARLLNPDDPAWLGHREDLFKLSVRSVHIGQKR